MIGILLLGGKAKRLQPLTICTNKHLLPVYSDIMASFSFDFLLKSGVTKLIIISDKTHKEKFAKFFEERFNLKESPSYLIQSSPLGTGHAVKLCRDYIKGKQFVVLCGDNIFEHNLFHSLSVPLINTDCRIYLTKSSSPRDYGVVEIVNKKIVDIKYQPRAPKSNIVCTGCFVFSPKIFNILENTKFNKKGELELMDAVGACLDQDRLEFEFIKGAWHDAGTSFDTLLEAAITTKKLGVNKDYAD